MQFRMPKLENPQHEKACEQRASGCSQTMAYRAGFGIPAGDRTNATRFFRQAHIRARVAEIVHRRAVLADLDDAFVLRQLKAIAGNGEANLDDYFVRNSDGQRIGIDLSQVPREKMAAIEEVTVEEFAEGPRDDPRTI